MREKVIVSGERGCLFYANAGLTGRKKQGNDVSFKFPRLFDLLQPSLKEEAVSLGTLSPPWDCSSLVSSGRCTAWCLPFCLLGWLVLWSVGGPRHPWLISFLTPLGDLEFIFWCRHIKRLQMWLKSSADLLPPSSVGQNSDMVLTGLKSHNRQGCVPFWSFQRKTCFLTVCISYRLLTFLGSWPLPHLQNQQHCISDSSSIASNLSDHSQERFSAFKDPHDYIELTWILQDTHHGL